MATFHYTLLVSDYSVLMHFTTHTYLQHHLVMFQVIVVETQLMIV